MQLFEVSVDHVKEKNMSNFKMTLQSVWFTFAVDRPLRPSLAAKIFLFVSRLNVLVTPENRLSKMRCHEKNQVQDAIESVINFNLIRVSSFCFHPF